MPRQALRELVLESQSPVSEACAFSIPMLSQIHRAFNCSSLFSDIPDVQEIALRYQLAHGYGEEAQSSAQGLLALLLSSRPWQLIGLLG